MAARAALILSGAGCVLPSVSSGIAVLAGTLRLKYICPRGSIAAFAFGSRLSFFLCQEKRDGLRYVPFLFRRVEIAIRAFSDRRCGYPALWVHFGLARFFMAIPTENERNEGTRRTESAARRLCAFA